jgi:ElaB/YqjD/DUF883 family membrane-anchored ribosome-binding protein
MGVFNDLKKLLFGVKSVTKHTAEKVETKAAEKKTQLVEETEQLLEDLSEEFNQKTTAGKAKIKAEAKDLVDKTKKKTSEFIDDIKESEVYKKTSETLDKVGDAILDTGEKFYDKTKEVLEGPGKEMAEMAKEVSEEMGDKIKKTGKKVVDKAKEVAADLEEKFDKTYQKAQDEAAKEAAKPKSEFADTPLDAGGSTLKGTDDFFEKASKYADGDYGSDPKIIEKKDQPATTKDTKVPLEGFEDKDGDGDELIDDAEIVDEEPPPKE